MRLPARIIIALVFGALCTVVVAWGCTGARLLPGDTSAATTAPRGGGDDWPVDVPAEWGRWSLRASKSALGYDRVVCTGLRAVGEQVLAERGRAGLPFAALESRVRGKWTRGSNDLRTTGLPAIGARDAVVLPVVPIAGGFVADSVIYGAIAFGLLSRGGRSSRATCPECGGRPSGRRWPARLLRVFALACLCTVCVSWICALLGNGYRSAPSLSRAAPTGFPRDLGLHEFRGWPLGAMVSSRTLLTTDEAPFSIARGVCVAPAKGASGAVYLPLTPRPTEFALNTLLAALVLLSLNCALVLARRLGRERTNRCGECGYPLTGLRNAQ